MTTKITTDNIASETLTTILGPKVSSIVYPGDDTAANTAGGDSITLLGSGFNNGASVIVNGTSAGVVTVVSSTQITFTAPAQTAGTYVIYVINSDGGTAISIPGISYSGTPNWSTTAGNIGVGYETGSISTTVTATGDDPITYSVVSGTLPTGSSLNTSSGLISGTASATASSTTYSFTIKATDAQNQDTNRAFSITVNPDVVTWSSPANSTTYEVFKDIAIANVEMSATSASGGSITYTADTLPTGVSITGANIAGTPTVADSTSTTLTATSTSTRSATRTINWVVSIANDTYFKNVTLLLNGETTVTPFISDASTNSFGLTINGDTKPVLFNPYRGDGYYSAYFDGTGDMLTIPSPTTGLSFGTGEFTIEMWVYKTSAENDGLLDARSSPAATPWFLGIDGSNFPYLYDGTSYTSSVAVTLNSWNHVSLVRTSGVLKIFVNGVQGYSASYGTNLDRTAGLVIGDTIHAAAPLLGYISNLRIVKGTAVYTSAFTPPTSPLTAIANTSLLTCQSNRLIDNSTNNFTITKVGDTAVSSAIPFTANSSYSTYGSTYFDGTGDYLTAPSNVALNLTGDFTIEFWAYPTASISSKSIAGTTTSSMHFDSGGAFYLLNSISQYLRATDSSFLTLNTWTHVAITRSGSTLKFFRNGVDNGIGENVGSASTATFTFSGLNIGYSPHVNASSYLTGYISNFRIVKGTAVYTANFTPSTTPLTAIANTSLLTLQYNGGANNKGIIDNSNFNNIITRNGNTSQGTFSPYSVTGWSSYMTSSTTVAPTTNAAFTWGTGNYTIEMWYNPSSSYAASNAYLFDQGSNQTRVQLYNNYVRFFYNNGATELTSTTAGLGLTIGTWYHLAIVRNSSVITMYINGISCATVNSSADETSTSMKIGNYGGGGIGFNGYMSNFRAVKGTAVYTGNFTPSTSPLSPIIGTSILTLQSNRFVDNSPNSFTLTRTGDVSVQAFGPFGSVPEAVPISYSNYFDGTGDYLTTPANSSFVFGTSDFTIEAWIYRTVSSASYIAIITNWSTGWFFGFNNNTFTLLKSGGATVISDTVTSSLNSWNHYCVSRSGSTVRLFVDGVLKNTVTDANDFSGSNTIHIGITDGVNHIFTGSISNLRVVKGTAVYTSAFTPSTTPLTAIANTSLLICQSTRMIDNSTNNFTLTANGNTVPRIFNPFGYTAQSSTSYTPTTHGGSIYLDGTGDYLTIPYASYYDIPASTAFTFECWVYTSSTNTFIIANRNWSYGGSGPTWAFSLNSGITPQWSIAGTGSATYVMAVSSIGGTINAWNHYAFTRDGSYVVRIFVNGVLGASRTDAQAMTSASGLVYIGAPTNLAAYSTGYISDIRLNNGVAIYTSNFVPPTTSLTAITNTSLLLNFTNGGIIDLHGSNVLETVGNTQLSTSIKKYGNSSIYFDGTGDYLKVPSSVAFEFGTSDFTWEAWVYFNSTGSRIIDFNTGILWLTSGTLQYYSGSGRITSNALTLGQWYHVALVRASGVTKMYINGTQNGVNFTDSINYPTNALIIGADSGSLTQFMNGYIDDLRITKGYARYTSNFTPPTSALIGK